jgi:mono/diheme cytochrome c family protein
MKNKFLRFSLILGITAFGVSVVVTSCNEDPRHPGYEFMPDMYRSPSYETYSLNPNFKDSMTARRPVMGTIPRDPNYVPYLYPNTPEGYEAAGKELKNPLEKSEVNMAEGKRLYENFCTHCHGAEGKADGLVVTNGGFPPPPAYTSAQLKDLPEGKMFHSVTYGKNLMGSHASQLDYNQRWKIIMYVQTLQKMEAAAAPAPADSTQQTDKNKKS